MSDSSKKQVNVTWNPSSTTTSLSSIPTVNQNDYDNLISELNKQALTEPSSIIDNEKNTSKIEEEKLDSAYFSNNKIKETLSSILTVDTSKAGTYVFYGNIDGYSKQVKLTLIIKAINTVRYFPLLSDVPQPLGVNYKNYSISDGKVFYFYNMSDISYSSINQLFTSYGWKYYDTSYLNGNPMYFWSKGASLVALSWVGYDRVIIGNIH